MKKSILFSGLLVFGVIIFAQLVGWNPFSASDWKSTVSSVQSGLTSVGQKIKDVSETAADKVSNFATSSWEDIKKASSKAKDFAVSGADETKNFANVVYKEGLKPAGDQVELYGKTFGKMVQNWFKSKPKPEYCNLDKLAISKLNEEAPYIDSPQAQKVDTENYAQLIQQYSPIVWLEQSDIYSPTTFSEYMTAPTTSIVSLNDDSVVIPKGQVTFEKVYETYKNRAAYENKNIAFDVADCTLFGADPDKNKNASGDLATPAYVVAYEADNKIYIQYLFFYGLNGPYDIGPLRGNIADIQNYHESDLEHITLVFDKNTRTPLQIYYGSHGKTEGFWLDWNNPDVEKEGTHPVVYSAHYGHGLYPKNGTYVRIYGLANDVTGRGTKWNPKWIRLYPETDSRFDPKTMGFMYFAGTYGRHGVGPMALQGWFMNSKDGDIGRNYNPSSWFCSNTPYRDLEKKPWEAPAAAADEITYAACIIEKIPQTSIPD